MELATGVLAMTTGDQFHRFVLVGPGHTVIVWRQSALLDGGVVCRAMVLTCVQAGERARAILAGAP
jgi:hypothetical protein